MRNLARIGRDPSHTPVAGAGRIGLPRSGFGDRAGTMPVTPVAPRTRIGLVSADRQSACDTSRITRQLVSSLGVGPRQLL
jgi:hypothetical protein